MSHAPATPIWEGQSDSVDTTLRLGAAIGRMLQPGDIVALDGELGAGKTQFVRGVAEGMGIDPRAVASPTFVLVHEYEAEPDQPVLVHIDAYRLNSLSDLESIGWDTAGFAPGSELMDNAALVIEWASRLGPELGSDGLHVQLEHRGDEQRRITIAAGPGWIERGHALYHALAMAAKPAESSTKCPICNAPVDAQEPTFPFCSKRCRMIDLGKWLGGDYRISRPIEQRDLDEE